MVCGKLEAGNGPAFQLARKLDKLEIFWPDTRAGTSREAGNFLKKISHSSIT